jgi:hypothetical protein
MIITRKQFDKANEGVYWRYEYQRQDLEKKLERTPKSERAKRAELEREIEKLSLAVNALDEFKIQLGLIDKSGLILVND